MNGSAFALARWFQSSRYVNRPEDDFVREEVLAEVWNAEAVGIAEDGTVFVRTPHGACAIEKITEAQIVNFDYVENDRWTRTTFWMNASSVRSLGERLRSVPRESADAIFLGQEVSV